ncbi:hypothetical protein [uncultured Roseobacter sp.]|uniref:hypothetical protein n=1 Tax=uncultured Roseobacter sp. TaxID=114847 RepID=UPI0026103F98|nr:hypothetical protein [uncultured Roseobacter sp.]
MTSIEEIAIQQVNSGLQNQRDNVRHLRTQSTVVATTSVLLAGFLHEYSKPQVGEWSAHLSPNDPGLNLSNLIGLALMIVSIVFALKSVLLRPRWLFVLSPDMILDDIDRLSDFTKEEKLDLVARALFSYFEKNEDELSRMQSSVFFSICAAVAQIPFWLI